MYTVYYKYNTLRGITVRHVLSDTNNLVELQKILSRRCSYASSVEILRVEKNF